MVEQIGAQARHSNLRRVDELDQLLDGVGTEGLSDEQRRGAADLAHELVGSAGTFGYGRVSQWARELEQLLLEHNLPRGSAALAATRVLDAIRADLLSEPDYDAD